MLSAELAAVAISARREGVRCEPGWKRKSAGEFGWRQCLGVEMGNGYVGPALEQLLRPAW